MDLVANRDVYGKTLLELGKQYENIVALDADLSSSTRSNFFANEFPERFFNVGVAEQNLAGFAAGLASCGKVAFISTFAMFGTGRAWEQLRNTVSYNKLNVKIVCTHAGITVGEDGSSHQSLEDISIMRSIPGMTVVVPCDGHETRKAVIAAYHFDGPVYIRLNRPKLPLITDEKSEFIIGKATQLKEGSDVTIISAGLVLCRSLEAAQILAKENISVRVINMHTIKPLDKDIIVRAAKETGAIVTVEEHSIIGGLGSAVAEVTSQECPVFIELVGTKDVFGQSGTPDELCTVYDLDVPDIISAVKKVLSKK